MINSNTLKYIAFLTMTIDHIGLLWFEEIVFLRIIGRIAFVLFAFLLVQGYTKTKNYNKYLLRLFIFALISEPCFDLMVSGKIFNFAHQNVMWTLLFGLITLKVYDYIRKYINEDYLVVIFSSISLILFSSLAIFGKFDYDWLGIILINLLYVFKNKQKLVIIILSLIIYFLGSQIQIWMVLAVPLLMLFNDKKMLSNKGWYAYYPLHMLILFLIDRWL